MSQLDPAKTPNRIFGMTPRKFGIVAGLVALVLVVGGGLVILASTLPGQMPVQLPTVSSTATLSVSSTATPFTGDWQVSTGKSDFDGSTTVVLSLGAESPVQGWLSVTTPSLILRCQEGKVDVYVDNGTQANVEFGLYNSATVRLRFDENPAFQTVASESTDGKALFLQNPYDMIAAMLQSQEMVYGFTPFNANPVVTKFQLKRTCGGH